MLCTEQSVLVIKYTFFSVASRKYLPSFRGVHIVYVARGKMYLKCGAGVVHNSVHIAFGMRAFRNPFSPLDHGGCPVLY